MEDFCCLPIVIAHADWSSHPKKRWVVRAYLKEDGYYWVAPPERVQEPTNLVTRLQQDAGPRGLVLLGFDFPIGLPLRYAQQCGIDDFVTALPQFGQGEWANFYQVAEQPDQISLKRPFYPQRPGQAQQSHLTEALGVQSINELRRQCEFAHSGRRAAAPLFWTMGGQQVGKAAISGWQEILGPALYRSSQSTLFWPFAGTLFELCQTGKTVIAETYPAEFYHHLGVVFSPRRPGQKSGKRSQPDRIANAPGLLAWAERTGLVLAPQMQREIQLGFGASSEAEDAFDATIGLFGMLNIVLGQHSPGELPSNQPEAERLRKIEGWILGQEPGLFR